jgi:hypothetical protein
MYAFGTGVMWATPNIDAFGNTVANPTPVQFGELQDSQIDISRDLKELIGQNQFPVAVAVGKGKVGLKAKLAKINGALIDTVFSGQGFATGTLTAINNDTTGAAIPASPYQVTVAPPSSGTFTRDLGVIDWNGNPMTKVASAPATGQYSVTAGGQYTFAAADTGKLVFINYVYTLAQAGAKALSFQNLPMGQTPIFGIDLKVGYAGKNVIWRFPNCVSGKLTFGTKQDDFTILDLDIAAFADSTGRVFYEYAPE